MLSYDAMSQLHAAVQSAPTLAIDESSDVTDNTQLLVYVRLFHQDKKEICEVLLGITLLETHTRREDIYEAIKEMLLMRGIDLTKVVSVTTEGVTVLLT